MDELLSVLKEEKPDVDFEKENCLIDEGVLDSFDIVNLIYILSEKFDIEIPAEEISAENFNSMSRMWAMITRLKED